MSHDSGKNVRPIEVRVAPASLPSKSDPLVLENLAQIERMRYQSQNTGSGHDKFSGKKSRLLLSK